MKGYVYILKSLKDDKSYIGSTPNVIRRLSEHNKGYVKSTKSRIPLILTDILEYENLTIARKMENKFKNSHNTLIKELIRQRRLVHR